MDQREFIVKYAKDNSIALKNKDIYEFGMSIGKSLVKLRRYMVDYDVTCHNIYCFDSFIGLPHHEPGTPNNWFKGAFNAVTRLGVNTVQEAIQAFQDKITFSPVQTHFIPGFYKDSLNKALTAKYDFKPAYYVDVDVDLYSSTVECLDFMFRNNLIQPGTFIAYDDWGGTVEYEGGESKAHVEIMSKYNATTEHIYTDGDARPCIRKVFVIHGV